MPSTVSTLKAIDSASGISWSEFMKNLPDKPVAFTERSEWRELLLTVGALADMELITLVRDRNSNDILTLALTELGRERLRESAEVDRLAVERRQSRIGKDRRRFA